MSESEEKVQYDNEAENQFSALGYDDGAYVLPSSDRVLPVFVFCAARELKSTRNAEGQAWRTNVTHNTKDTGRWTGEEPIGRAVLKLTLYFGCLIC